MTHWPRKTAFALMACVLVLSGCATWAQFQRDTVDWAYPHAAGESLSQTPEDHYQMAARISAHDARALVEDLDIFFLTDRPTRLTRWHGR